MLSIEYWILTVERWFKVQNSCLGGSGVKVRHTSAGDQCDAACIAGFEGWGVRVGG